MTDILNLPMLHRLAALWKAVDDGGKCEWRFDDSGRTVDAVARCFTSTTDDRRTPPADMDVRDAWVWFSGTFEMTLPVREILTMMEEGTFYIY